MAISKETFDDRDYELARHAHDTRTHDIIESDKFSVSFAHAAIRAPGIAGAASLAGLLGFVTANYDRIESQLPALTDGLRNFAIAVLCSVVASGIAYLAQSAITERMHKHTKTWEHPWVHNTASHKKWVAISESLKWIGVLLIFASYWYLIKGALVFNDLAIQTLSIPAAPNI